MSPRPPSTRPTTTFWEASNGRRGLAVEAVPLEEDFDTLVASLAIDDTLEDKLAKLKKNVDEKLADYMDVKRIKKDEDFKAAKKYRTAVNAVKEPIEEQRKAAKKKYKDLLKTFDETIGEITAPIDKLSDKYKAEIDRYDGECRARRLAALKGHYYDLAGEMGPLVPYERIADDKWLNASFGEVKAKNIIERRVGELLHQFKFVNGLDYADESEKAVGRGVVGEDPAGGLGRGGGCGRRAPRGGRQGRRTRGDLRAGDGARTGARAAAA